MGVTGTNDEGQVRQWRSVSEAAAELGTTTGTLRVYMHYDKPYKGYFLDFTPTIQLKLF